MNAISDSSKFTKDETQDIATTISSSMKADKMVESILISAVFFQYNNVYKNFKLVEVLYKRQ